MTDQQRHTPVIGYGERGELRYMRCSCGHNLTSANPDTEYAYHLAAMQVDADARLDRRVTEVLGRALEHPHIRELALAWAKADRAADDRSADLLGIERVIAKAGRPIPTELIAARERAEVALREACRAEGVAESELKEAAVRLLNAEQPEGDASHGQ